MNSKEMVAVFEFVAREVDRLQRLVETDPKKALKEVGLHPGLPLTHEDFPIEHYLCGNEAAKRLYKLAETKLRETPDLNGRLLVETFYQAIQVEFAQRVLAKGAEINEATAKEVLSAAKQHVNSRLENRTYFLPVYSIEEDVASPHLLIQVQ